MTKVTSSGVRHSTPNEFEFHKDKSCVHCLKFIIKMRFFPITRATTKLTWNFWSQTWIQKENNKKMKKIKPEMKNLSVENPNIFISWLIFDRHTEMPNVIVYCSFWWANNISLCFKLHIVQRCLFNHIQTRQCLWVITDKW